MSQRNKPIKSEIFPVNFANSDLKKKGSKSNKEILLNNGEPEVAPDAREQSGLKDPGKMYFEED